MTQSEFIKQFCEKCGISEKEFNDEDIFCIPCDCGKGGCQGWVMTNAFNCINNLQLYYSKCKN
jgi:hypothetical protein